MTAARIMEIKEVCYRFADFTAPFCPIGNPEDYEQALELVESFLEEAEDAPADSLNVIISILAEAIENYENKDVELLDFENRAMDLPPDLALLRVLMDQYGLGTSSLPEIGSKSMVSRVLSGERNLSKKHIQALSKRFGIDPGLFF
jgi:HTH-type transcriptional regulator/antitoxin HigA